MQTMILPIYTNINHQQFRQFMNRNDLLNQIRFFSHSNQLPTFQYSFTQLSDNYTVSVIYIDSLGIDIESVSLITDDYFIKKRFKNRDLLITKDNRLTFNHLHDKYYIKISDFGVDYFSEIIHRQCYFENNGLIMLNTNGYLMNNGGGGFLLNDSEDGMYLQTLISIKAQSSKTFSNFDLSNFELEMLIDADVYLENQYQSDESKEFNGLTTYFQRTLQSIYSIKILTTREICNNLDRLGFFDKVTIKDKYGYEFEATENLTITHERIETSGVYETTIQFKTKYDIDFTLSTDNDINMNSADVGNIIYVPSKLDIDTTLAVKNNYLQGTGYEFIKCTGQTLEPTEHPILAATLGTINVGGSDKIQIPDMSGKILIAAGSHTDKNSETRNFSSGAVDVNGEYSHKLTSNEMKHIHVIGGTKDTSRTAMFQNGDVAPFDVSDLNEYDDKIIPFNDFPVKETTKFSDNVSNARKLITTLNDQDATILNSRVAHNNTQPSVGAYAYMFIDNIANV